MAMYDDMVGLMNRGEMQDALRKRLPKGKVKTIGDIAGLKDQLNKAIAEDDYDKADEIRKKIEEAQRS